jgi:hypothetical protein
MKKLVVFVATVLSSALIFAHPDEPKTSKNNNVSWHSITVVDYKPGTVETAKEIMQKFESASKTAGTALPVIYWFKSGKYDLVVTWELEKGPADLEGTWSPEGGTWWDALVAQEGSEEAARQLQANYNALIDSSITNVACKAK